VTDSPSAAPSGPVLDDEALAVIERTLLADFDHRFGGFGSGAKFPHPDVLDYALMRHVERPGRQLSEILGKTLGAHVQGGLHDPVEGGFFRGCSERDWSRPITEKTLDGNLGLARVLMGAGRHLDREDLAVAGRAALEFVRGTLRDDETGLFLAGLGPDDAYYALDAAHRSTRSGPRPDARLLADANARAVVALARGAVLLDDPELAADAHSLVAELLRRLWRPGRGMLHVLDKSGSHDADHLADLAECACAVLVVHEQTGDRRLIEPLTDLLDGIMARHVLPSGDLGDRADGASGRSLLWAAVGAQALLRSSWLLGRPELRVAARRVLALHAVDHRRHGDAMAAFGRALATALRPPVRVVVLGAADDDTTSALRERAAAHPVLDRVIVPLDPEHDGDRITALGLPVPSAPRAHVLLPTETAGATDSPDELTRLLARAVERRHAAAPHVITAAEAN
jgi:uncharacterized protein YyaL (SSP411 family)